MKRLYILVVKKNHIHFRIISQPSPSLYRIYQNNFLVTSFSEKICFSTAISPNPKNPSQLSNIYSNQSFIQNQSLVSLNTQLYYICCKPKLHQSSDHLRSTESATCSFNHHLPASNAICAPTFCWT